MQKEYAYTEEKEWPQTICLWPGCYAKSKDDVEMKRHVFEVHEDLIRLCPVKELEAVPTGPKPGTFNYDFNSEVLVVKYSIANFEFLLTLRRRTTP